MSSVSVSSKGQVVIPITVRQRLGIKPGTRLQLSEEAGELRLKPIRPDAKFAAVEDGIGLAGYRGPPVSIAAMNRAVKEAAAESYLRSLSPAGRKARTARGRKSSGG